MLSFWIGLMLGFALMGMLAGLLIIWSDRPKRNCDIGTPEEQYYRFADYCAKHAPDCPDIGARRPNISEQNGYDMCKGCPLENVHDCRITWMNMPYKKEN